jgi:hypothetical protein
MHVCVHSIFDPVIFAVQFQRFCFYLLCNEVYNMHIICSFGVLAPCWTQSCLTCATVSHLAVGPGIWERDSNVIVHNFEDFDLYPLGNLFLSYYKSLYLEFSFFPVLNMNAYTSSPVRSSNCTTCLRILSVPTIKVYTLATREEGSTNTFLSSNLEPATVPLYSEQVVFILLAYGHSISILSSRHDICKTVVLGRYKKGLLYFL